jgi:hypothetical protein
MTVNRLGRFEITREIGKGAMGQVFLARDPKIDRPVAIKTIVLPPGTSAEEAHETSQRFLREAQAAGRLLHPNIITIFDVGEEAGVSFIAMEFIEGETLEPHTRQGGLLPLGRVHELISQAAAALDYAHEHGIVHRDIKPANLMVLKSGVLKVTDFGLAKSPQANLTQAGVLLGTPSYMSPEQIQGRDLDGRSDLFSLGVVLYELLTGVRPFEGDSISTIIYKVLYEEPRPPAAHNPALPSGINAVIDKALAKDPGDRHARGADLVADFGKALAGLPAGTLGQPLSTTGGGPARDPRSLATTVKRSPVTPRRGSRARAAARPAPREGAGASGPLRHPLKIVAAAVLAAAGLVLFPRGLNRPEGRAGIAGEMSRAGIAGAPPATRGDLPEAGTSGGGAGQVVIDVETMPPGGAIILDDTPLADPRVVLSLSDPSPHDIVARAGCRHAVAEMTAADLASFKEGPLVLDLHPREEELAVVSDPPGARLRVNGADSGRLTPTTLMLSACDTTTIALERAGYRPWTVRHDSEGDFDALVATLKQVALEPVPQGSVLIARPTDYDVEIFAGDRKIGMAGAAFGLPEGKHRLTFRNAKYFVHEVALVTVTGGRTVTPPIGLPSLGSLTVQAQPSNCKVFVDGAYIDVTPVLDLPIAAGGHRVRVVFVPTGSEQEQAVSVNAGKNSRVTVKF